MKVSDPSGRAVVSLEGRSPAAAKSAGKHFLLGGVGGDRGLSDESLSPCRRRRWALPSLCSGSGGKGVVQGREVERLLWLLLLLEELLRCGIAGVRGSSRAAKRVLRGGWAGKSGIRRAIVSGGRGGLTCPDGPACEPAKWSCEGVGESRRSVRKIGGARVRVRVCGCAPAGRLGLRCRFWRVAAAGWPGRRKRHLRGRRAWPSARLPGVWVVSWGELSACLLRVCVWRSCACAGDGGFAAGLRGEQRKAASGGHAEPITDQRSRSRRLPVTCIHTHTHTLPPVASIDRRR